MRPETYQENHNSQNNCKTCNCSENTLDHADNLHFVCQSSERFPHWLALKSDYIHAEIDSFDNDDVPYPNLAEYEREWLALRRVSEQGCCDRWSPRIARVIQFRVPHPEEGKVIAIACTQDGESISFGVSDWCEELPDEFLADLNTAGCHHDFFCDLKYPDGWQGYGQDDPPDNWDGRTAFTEEEMRLWRDRGDDSRYHVFYGDES